MSQERFINGWIRVEWVIVTILVLVSSAALANEVDKGFDYEMRIIIIVWMLVLSFGSIVTCVALWSIFKGTVHTDDYRKDQESHSKVHWHFTKDVNEIFDKNIKLNDLLRVSVEEKTKHMDEKFAELTRTIESMDRRRTNLLLPSERERLKEPPGDWTPPGRDP